MRFECWINKITNTHSEYVIFEINDQPDATTAVFELLMMGGKTPET
jgi:hypothetical protein